MCRLSSPHAGPSHRLVAPWHGPVPGDSRWGRCDGCAAARHPSPAWNGGIPLPFSRPGLPRCPRGRVQRPHAGVGGEDAVVAVAQQMPQVHGEFGVVHHGHVRAGGAVQGPPGPPVRPIRCGARAGRSAGVPPRPSVRRVLSAPASVRCRAWRRTGLSGAGRRPPRAGCRTTAADRRRDPVCRSAAGAAVRQRHAPRHACGCTPSAGGPDSAVCGRPHHRPPRAAA